MTDCIVIGGGILGMMTARELAQAGLQVTLLERNQTGRESSWAGGGIISPLYPWRFSAAVTALASWSQAAYPELAEQLRAESGIDPEYTRSGLLILDTEEQARALAWAEQSGNRLEPIGRAEIAAYEPSLNHPPAQALRLDYVAQVRNPRLVKALRAALEGKVEVRERTEVQELLVVNGRVQGVRTAAGRLAAPRVVVCAGAWSRNLLADMGSAPEIEPVHGQMILFRARPGLIRRIVLHRDRYAIPRLDGRVLMGSTLEHTGFDKHPTDSAREELLAVALEMFPALGDYPIENHWAGLRPGSPHGVPYIGAYPMAEGVYINAGHFRNGVVLAPGSARLLADILLGREPILPSAAYALDAPRHAT
jgi:glycine oxidase